MTCPHCGSTITGPQLATMMRSVNSEAQQKAARENGKKGGRPKKVKK